MGMIPGKSYRDSTATPTTVTRRIGAMKPARSTWQLMAMTMVIIVSMVVTTCGPTATPPAPPDTPAPEQTPQLTAEPTPQPTPIAEQKLRIAVMQLPVKVDETEGSSASWTVTWLVYDALVHMGTDGNPVPGLAVSWEPIDDTTWQFKLRQGVKFHNGEDFDANAVKFSLDYILNPDNAIYYARFLGTIQEVQVVDEYTVNIITNVPDATLLGALVGARIRPPKYFAEVGAERFGQAPIGTGPFKLVEFVPDQHVILERNDDYWGDVPLLDTVEFVEMTEASTRMAALEAGEVDLAQNMPVDQVQRLQDAGLEIDSEVIAETRTILLVSAKQREDYPFLSDKRVRQALNYAVDKEEIVNTLTGGYGRPCVGQFVGPDGFGYDPDFTAYQYDPDKARELLAEAGYPDGFEFKLANPVGRYTYGDDMVQAVAGYLAEIGVNVEVEPMESAAWAERYQAGELAVTVVVPNYYPTMDVDRIVGAFHSTKGRNWLQAPEVDPLIEEERTILDPDERLQVLHQLTAALADEAPVIWVMFPPQIYGYSPRVHDVGFRSDGLFDLSKAYIG
jgi:peptide/nickel transport system substrate-binding protein